MPFEKFSAEVRIEKEENLKQLLESYSPQLSAEKPELWSEVFKNQYLDQPNRKLLEQLKHKQTANAELKLDLENLKNSVESIRRELVLLMPLRKAPTAEIEIRARKVSMQEERMVLQREILETEALTKKSLDILSELEQNFEKEIKVIYNELDELEKSLVAGKTDN